MKAFNELSIKDQGRELMQVELTPLTVAALDNYLEWSKDKEVVDFIGGGKELSAEEIENRFQQILRSKMELKGRELKLNKLIAEIDNSNVKSIRLFESSGFSFVRDLPDMGAKIYEKAIK